MKEIGTGLDRRMIEDINENFDEAQRLIDHANRRVGNLLTGTSQPQEIVDAHLGVDGTLYRTIKDRLDAEQQKTNSQLAQTASDVVKKANASDVRLKDDQLAINDFKESDRAVLQGLSPGQINAVLGPGNVSNTNLNADISMKNYPFASTVTVDSNLKSIVKDIKLFNLDVNKDYTLAVFNVTQIRIYEWVNNNFGVIACQLNDPNYTPKKTIEDINLFTLNGEIGGSITVDWSKFTTPLTNRRFDIAGLSTVCHINTRQYTKLTDDQLVILKQTDDTLDRKIERETKIPKSYENNIKISNTDPLVNQNGWVTGIELRFKKQDVLFNSFSIKTHDVSSDASYVGCLIYVDGSIKEEHFLPYRKNENITFLFENQYNLQSGEINIRFAYLNKDKLTISLNQSTAWSTTVDDPNVTALRIIRRDNLISGNVEQASTTWKSFNYSLGYSSISEYIPIKEAVRNVEEALKIIELPNNNVRNLIINLPSTIYMPIGSDYYYYEDSIIKYYEVFEKSPLQVKLKAAKQDGTVITPYQYMRGQGMLKSNQGDYNLTMDILNLEDENKIIATKDVSVKTKARSTGKSLKTLFIGDSYLDNKYGDGILKYLDDFAKAENNTIEFIGKRTSQYGYLSESRASWSESHFYNRYVPADQRIDANGDPTSNLMSSPFVFSPDDTVANAKFDFGEYLSSNNISNIDSLVFFLGMNGGSGSNIKLMIENIRMYKPDIKILICAVPPAEHYKYDRDSVSRQLGRINQNESLFSLFENTDGVYIVPTNMNFHRVYSLRHMEQEQVQFNLDGIPKKTVALDHHPSASGAKGIAYMIYNYMLL